ncbi:MAG: LysM peptidoglycan-binding domain-containing protein [Spirochaetales bacterium]
MTRALMQQQVAGRPRARKRSPDPARLSAARPVTDRTPRRTVGAAGAAFGRVLRVAKTLLLVIVAIGLVYALFVYVPELKTVAQEQLATAADAERFEAAAMPDFANVLASLPRREVVFEMTDDIEYLVQEGETLSEIATRFDVTTRFLAEYNSLANADFLNPGQAITIPSRQNRP